MKMILNLDDIIPLENVERVGGFLLKEGMRAPVAHAFLIIAAERFLRNLTCDAVVSEGEFGLFSFESVRVGQLAGIIKRMFPMDSIIPLKMYSAGWGDFNSDFFYYDKIVNSLRAFDMLYRKDVVVGHYIPKVGQPVLTVECPFSL